MYKRCLRKDLDLRSDDMGSRCSAEEFVRVDVEFSSDDGTTDDYDDVEEVKSKYSSTKNPNSDNDDDNDDAVADDDDDDEDDNTSASIFMKRYRNKKQTRETTTTTPMPEELVGVQESKGIHRLRIVAIMALLMTATAISTSLYLIMKQSEQNEFTYQYHSASDAVIASFGDFPKRNVEAMTSLQVVIEAIISSATSTNGNHSTLPILFPNLTDFTAVAKNALSLSDAIYVTMNYYISVDQRDDWKQLVHSRIESTPWENATSDEIYYLDDSNQHVMEDNNNTDPYMIELESSPLLVNYHHINMNLFHTARYRQDSQLCYNTQSIVISETFQSSELGDVNSHNNETAFYAHLLQQQDNHDHDVTTTTTTTTTSSYYYDGSPFSHVYIPIFFPHSNRNHPITGQLKFMISWSNILSIPRMENPATSIMAVLSNDGCQDAYTFRLTSNGTIQYIGMGDLHDTDYELYGIKETLRMPSFPITDSSLYGLNVTTTNASCPISITLYPTQESYNAYHTNQPIAATMAVVVSFALTILIFLCYDRQVQQRQTFILRKAIQSTMVVASLFPKVVREKLLSRMHHSPAVTADSTIMDDDHHDHDDSHHDEIPECSMRRCLIGNDTTIQHQTIAELFPHTTVLFSDICGFTAWSSTREPTQVFILLQTVYLAFDAIAKRRNVFKVETIGDSYVAVTGLPEPQHNHAVIMARFAADCLHTMIMIARDLEMKLGPDTGELCMRFGLNSGPVTAGILRGERARFQLFGDTVNTASRMESTGHSNMIQASQSTALLLQAADKGHWLTERHDAIHAKGKGTLKTFWVNPHAFKPREDNHNNSSNHNDTDSGSVPEIEKVVQQETALAAPVNPKKQGRRLPKLKKDVTAVKNDRLVDWIYQLLYSRIQVIVGVRAVENQTNNVSLHDTDYTCYPDQGKIPLDELTERIELPTFHEVNGSRLMDPARYANVALARDVEVELKCYIELIASLYQNNPFHNFAHACHVTMSVNKLLSRIVKLDRSMDPTNEFASRMHPYGHGIHSDPITLLAIMFSAVIHDCDHRGVTNVQLSKEQESMAVLYRHKSIAEQNSLDLAWNLLMSEQFANLRKAMFATESDMIRFRQVTVNLVLATDIFDIELNELRKNRWTKAFSQCDITDDILHDLQATIVMEHLIQASDVSHTMQHWHVYRKWNRLLFHEMLLAYRYGRMECDPSTFWYTGELHFFDHYVIPLAKKLKECQVFGVSSDEYLCYAEQNRAEWEIRGKEIVEEMLSEFNEERKDCDL